ncbi:hypothetical protein ANCDUO_01983 [Ancylostoma duodenale]|uniref:Reverse transcriptase domain-containing protein n=1 Tax=Ancylostoma duodenale TaxID=51022 RepID=A0A0C2DCV2_9BILA|nr:hypothetical protein ANCDUO_01983 [Ancylostoma duodenale]
MYPVTSGVSQGGVLSPLLFFIYIEDLLSILSVSTQGEEITYADGIKVYGTYSEAAQDNVTNALKISLQQLLFWATINGIHVNLSKNFFRTPAILNSPSVQLQIIAFESEEPILSKSICGHRAGIPNSEIGN